VLNFPGKLAADEAGGRLFISDSGNHRIVVTSLDGEVKAVIGSGEQGLVDGPADHAQFNRPQGLFYDADSDALYVADTQNHAIRRVDLAAMEVTTLAGDGQQSSGPEDGPGSETGRLASPWDVCMYGGVLYIAMAGTHQIWQLDPTTRELTLTAGGGRENMVDGPPEAASLSQPSGLAVINDVLYVADSENSAVRTVATGSDCSVSTITGAGLFEFGDRDGGLDQARLQHCIGICSVSDKGSAAKLFIADSYNNKIKQIDLGAGTISTLCGTGERGLADGDAGQAQFNEPNDVVLAAGKLYVADTNNHAIRTVDLSTGHVSALPLSGLDKLAPPPSDSEITELAVDLPPGESTLELQLVLPEGTKLNPGAQLKLEFAANDPGVLSVGSAVCDGLSIILPLDISGDNADLSASGPVYYCDAGNEGLCYVGRVSLRITITADDSAERVQRRTIAPDAG
jgi:DNA-binding beta-propeller fold protein YncE